MKHISILLFFLTTALFSFAQIHKGSILTGGNLAFSAFNSHNTNPLYDGVSKNRSYLFSPSTGVAVRENKVVGLGVTYGWITNDYGTSKIRNYIYGSEVFYRQFLNLGKNFLFYGEGSAGFTKLKTKYFNNTNIESRDIQTNINANISVGIAYLAGRRFMLELGLSRFAGFGYQKIENIYPSTPNANSDQTSWQAFGSLSLASSLTIGCRFILGNK